MEKRIDTTWHPDQRLIITTLRGKLKVCDLSYWEESLHTSLKQIGDQSEFKILVNLYGFEAENFLIHQEYRTIIPLLLADYGYRIGYLDMFPEANLIVKNIRGIQCIAMANVHHDEEKMADYEMRFGKSNEKYFTEYETALNWITTVK